MPHIILLAERPTQRASLPGLAETLSPWQRAQLANYALMDAVTVLRTIEAERWVIYPTGQESSYFVELAPDFRRLDTAQASQLEPFPAPTVILREGIVNLDAHVVRSMLARLANSTTSGMVQYDQTGAWAVQAASHIEPASLWASQTEPNRETEVQFPIALRLTDAASAYTIRRKGAAGPNVLAYLQKIFH